MNNLSGLTGLTRVVNDASAAGDFNLTGNSAAIGAGGLSATVTSGVRATVGFSFNLGGPVTVGAGSELVVAGGVDGSGFVFGGGGVLELVAANPYVGDTVVNAGTLILGDALSALGTGTLFLTGTAASPVFFQASVGATVFSPVVVSGGSNTVSGSQPITFHENVTLNGTVTITDTSTVVSSPLGQIGGTFAGRPEGSTLTAGGRTFTIHYTPTAVTLTDTTTPIPTVGVSGGAATVGTSGTAPLLFTVTLSATYPVAVSVNYSTADGTAVSPASFAASGTLTFTPGRTSKTVTITANGTPTYTLPKQFTVVLSSPTNATIGSGTGTGTISFTAPSVSIVNTSATVGTSGTTPLTFTVSLSAASGVATTVQYATANGSAVSPADYAAASGTVTFTPGQTSQAVAVTVLGNPAFAAARTFDLTLIHGPVGDVWSSRSWCRRPACIGCGRRPACTTTQPDTINRFVS